MKLVFDKLNKALERLDNVDNNRKYISNLKACKMHGINYVHKYKRAKVHTEEETNLYNILTKEEPFSLLTRIELSIQDYNNGVKPF